MCHYCFLRSVFLIKLGDHLALVHHVIRSLMPRISGIWRNEQNGLSLLDELVDDAIVSYFAPTSIPRSVRPV